MSGILQALLASFPSDAGYLLYGWGKNNYGVLGLGDTDRRSSPVQVGSEKGWFKSSSSEDQSLVVKADGTLWAFGRNGQGQLGDGTSYSKSSPVQVGALTNWAQPAAGSLFSGCIKTDNTLWLWGSQSGGRQGNNTNSGPNVDSPVQLGAAVWAQVDLSASVNAAAIAIRTDGTLWGWGYRQGFRSGLDNSSSPVQIGVATNWAQISIGWTHCMAVSTAGSLWGWATSNFYGNIGDGTVIARDNPTRIGLLTDWRQVSANDYFTLSTKTNNTLFAWGRNGNGQLADGTVASRSSPVQVGALTNWYLAIGGRNHSNAIKTDGTLWGWGNSFAGLSLPYLTASNRSSPVQVGSETNWIDLGLKGNSTLALAG
jgi:alpha-tubulin suppressor-like RCC1 family protein